MNTAKKVEAIEGQDSSHELDSTETAKLKKIIADSTDLEHDMKAAHAQCRQAFAARKTARRNSKEATLKALKIAFGTYLAASVSKDSKLKFLKAAGLQSPLNTSSMLLNTVIKVTITEDRRRASYFAAVIKFAIRSGVDVEKFSGFVNANGGITKCVRLYRLATATKPVVSAGVQIPASVAMSISNPTVEKALSEAVAKAQSMAKKIKRQAVFAISPEGSCELLDVRRMPKPKGLQQEGRCLA